MRNLTTIIFFIFTIMVGICFAQKPNDNINFIAFRMEDFKRIPYHFVTIEITKIFDKTFVKVHSEPINKDKRWKYSRIDATFKIENNLFDKLVSKAIFLVNIDLTKAFIKGKDGNECSIEFGTLTPGSRIEYKFWSPYYKTQERRLLDFMNLCNELIVIAKLNPNDIL